MPVANRWRAIGAPGTEQKKNTNTANYEFFTNVRINYLGLTRLDEIQGARKRKREAYYRYGERLSDRRNEEIRQTRKSYYWHIPVRGGQAH